MTKQQYEQEIEKSKQKLQEWRDNNTNAIAESTQRPYTEILQDIAAWFDAVKNGTYKNENK